MERLKDFGNLKKTKSIDKSKLVRNGSVSPTSSDSGFSAASPLADDSSRVLSFNVLNEPSATATAPFQLPIKSADEKT
jgi:hypothetical protein